MGSLAPPKIHRGPARPRELFPGLERGRRLVEGDVAGDVSGLMGFIVI